LHYKEESGKSKEEKAPLVKGGRDFLSELVCQKIGGIIVKKQSPYFCKIQRRPFGRRFINKNSPFNKGDIY